MKNDSTSWAEDSRSNRRAEAGKWDHTAQHDLSDAQEALEELQEFWRQQKAKRQDRQESEKSDS